jgi:hypothetical protein
MPHGTYTQCGELPESYKHMCVGILYHLSFDRIPTA